VNPSIAPHTPISLPPASGTKREVILNQTQLSAFLKRSAVALLILAGAGLGQMALAQDANGRSLWSTRQTQVSAADLAGHQVVVMPAISSLPPVADLPASQTRLARLDPTLVLDPALLRQASGKNLTVIASVVEGRPSRFDSHEPRWAQFVAEDVVQWCFDKGFTGCVLDAGPALSAEDLAAVAGAIRMVHPQMPLYIAANMETNAALPASAGLYLEIPESAVDSLGKLASRAGLPPLVVVTSEDTRPSFHRALAEKVAAAGGRPFVTPPGLPGISLAPLRELSRKVLVLFGWDPAEAEKPMISETDTMMGELLQTPLETSVAASCQPTRPHVTLPCFWMANFPFRARDSLRWRAG